MASIGKTSISTSGNNVKLEIMTLPASAKDMSHHCRMPSGDGDIEHEPLSLDRSSRCQYNLGVSFLGKIG